MAPDPHRFSDRFSAFWLLALAGRLVQEIGPADRRRRRGPAAACHLRASTARSLFRTAADRAAFAEELGVAVTRLVDKYPRRRTGGHGAGRRRGGGRKHRLVVALHPSLETTHGTTNNPSAKEQDND